MAMSPTGQRLVWMDQRQADELERARQERDALRAVVAQLWLDTGRTYADASHPMWSNDEVSTISAALRLDERFKGQVK